MSASPFERPLPLLVLLRCKMVARVDSLVEDRPPFRLLGALGASARPLCAIGSHAEHLQDVQLWRSDGRWREDGKSNPLDIVGVEVRRQGATVDFEPFAASAGQKGPQP